VAYKKAKLGLAQKWISQIAWIGMLVSTTALSSKLGNPNWHSHEKFAGVPHVSNCVYVLEH
jgi:hypothetical protein